MYTERRKTNRTLTEWLNVFISIFREITVLNQRLEHRKHSVLHPALIIYREAHTNVAYTNFTTTLVTVTLLTVIWSLSLVQRGHWWCLQVLSIVRYHLFARSPLTATLQWMRTPRIGICTAWAWLEWGHCKLIPLTGEQLAATQPMVSISKITSVATSKNLTSSTIPGQASAWRWNTLTSVGTCGCIWQHVSGRVPLTSGTSTAVVPAASLTQDLVQCQAKTTLVITVSWTQSSAATSRLILQLSGGLELICKPCLRSKRSSGLSTEAVILQLWFRI